MNRCRILVVVFTLLLGLDLAFGQSVQSTVQQKLHPVFQALLARDLANGTASIASSVRTPSGLTKEGEPLYDAIITTSNPDAVRASGIHLNSVYGKFATAQLTRQDLLKLVQMNEVQYLDPGSISYPTLDVSTPEIGASLLHAGFLNNIPYRGKGVIVVIFDSGIDWRHLDFRDPVDTTKSRILDIWDQTLTRTGLENSPAGFNYGVEYSKQQIENELNGTPANVVREKDIDGHGTHVAGIAAGNGNSFFKKYVGVAPEADLIIVKGGDASFTESRIIDGLTYAAAKAKALVKPVVVNLSLGSQFGTHDGTRPYEVAVDSFVSSAGRAVAIAAGNDGGNYIHIDGSVSSGGSTSISINVPTYTPTPGTENDKFELDVWFESNIGITATITSPNSITLSVEKDHSGTAGSAADGTIDLFNTVNGSGGGRIIELVVHDLTSSVPKSGTWTLTLSGATGSASYNAWLSQYILGSSAAAIAGGNIQKTVAMPGTADGAITVASYVTKNGWPSINGSSYGYSGAPVTVGTISSFSSIGPTADARLKPEISAPGEGISSSLSASSSQDATWIMPSGKQFLSQGTSMASPHVAGAAALLLQVSPGLTASQIKSLLTSTALSDASTGSIPNMTWGYGKLDILRAAAKAINPQATVQRQTIAYEVDGTNGLFSPPLTGSRKYAVRFTPSISGQLTGMSINNSTAGQRAIEGAGPLVCEIWTNVAGSSAGIPGTKLGNTVLQLFSRLVVATNNIIDMIPSGVTVEAGKDYHLVIAVSNPQDTIKVRTDASPAVPTNRSSYFDGSRWVNLVDQSSGLTAANFRIRATVSSVSGLVSVNAQNPLPQKFELSQNYPNPFNPTTTIHYSLPVQTHVRLRVFDLVGREVASIVDEQQAAGNYVVNWRGTDNRGVQLASGVYFYKLEGAGQQITKKMLLLK